MAYTHGDDFSAPPADGTDALGSRSLNLLPQTESIGMIPEYSVQYVRWVALAALIIVTLVVAPARNALSQSALPVDTLLAHAQEHSRTQPAEALEMAERALALAQQTGDLSGQAQSLYEIGGIHHVHGRLDDALDAVTRSQQLFETAGDQAGLAGALNAEGYVHERRGQAPLALNAHLRALELYRQLGDAENVARVTDCIAIVYSRQENVTQALRYHRQAVEMYQELDSPRNLALSYNNLGVTLVDAGDYDEALLSLQHTLAFAEEADDQYLTVLAFNNIGLALNRLGQPLEAKESLMKGLRLSEEMGLTTATAAICEELGNVYLALGDLDLALHFAQRSLALAIEINDTHQTYSIQGLLAQIYAARGEYEQAYIYQQLHSAARDSLFDAEKAEIISRMQMNHEMEGMEQKIESLHQQNRIRSLQAQQRQNVLLGGLGVLVLVTGFSINRYRLKQRANRLLTMKNEEIERQREALRANLEEKSMMLEEKELLVREIHHRVKNNLQVLSSMLRLQAQALEDPAALSPMQDMQARVLSMSFLHRELYDEDDSTHVEMQRYVETLSRYLLHAFNADGRVRCRVHAHDAWFNADTAVPLGLILNELLSNSIKHAFPDGKQGSVRVDLCRVEAEDWYELTVSDDGTGWSGRTAPEQRPTVGLTLVRMMARQLRGTMQQANGIGLTHTIRFKAKRAQA